VQLAIGLGLIGLVTRNNLFVITGACLRPITNNVFRKNKSVVQGTDHVNICNR
jgi:hypothetical protein